MTNLKDFVKQALEKKQAQQNTDHNDTPDVNTAAKKTVAPVVAAKPVKKSSGRGR